jgi:hypothetical protein
MLTHTHTHATPPYCSTRYSRSDVTERNKKYNKSSKFMDLQFRRVWSTKGKRAGARATVCPERTTGGPLIFFFLHCFFLLQIFTALTPPPPASSTACCPPQPKLKNLSRQYNEQYVCMIARGDYKLSHTNQVSKFKILIGPCSAICSSQSAQQVIASRQTSLRWQNSILCVKRKRCNMRKLTS